MKFKAVIHDAEEGGFWAEVPALPGCMTQGEQLEEMEENIREAIKAWLSAAEPDNAEPPARMLEVAL